MTITTPRRLGLLAAAALFAAAACSSSGASSAPSSATTAQASQAPASAAASTPASAGASAPAMTLPEPAAANTTLQGAGATFPAPLYNVWFETYTGKYPQVQFNYTANGSGAGIKAITQQTVDFGASDAAMKDEEIAALPAGTKILHVPTALGAVVVIFNVPGVDKLQLDAANVAGIFLGTITKWNDPAIAANNPGVTLPDQAINVVHRSDGSGTTNAFTTYLDTVSPDWHTKVGKGKEVKWPVGPGRPGQRRRRRRREADRRAPSGYVELQYATHGEAHLGATSRTPTASSSPGRPTGSPRPPRRSPPTSRPTPARPRSSTAPAPRPTRSRPTPTSSSTRPRPTRPRARTWWPSWPGR